MRPDLRVEFSRPLAGLKLHHPVAPTVDRIDVDWVSGVRDRMAQDAAMRESLASTIDSLVGTLDSIGPQVSANLQQIASMATELGLAIAREVVGVAIDDGLLDPTDIVLRCLRQQVQGANDASLRVELAPNDLDQVIAALDSHPELRDQAKEIDFVPNPSLGPSCVQVSSSAGCLVYDPEEVLDRICNEVRNGVAS